MINHFVVPGGGLDFSSTPPTMGPFSQARAEYMAEMYHGGLELTPGESLIVCVGSHQTLPEGVPEPAPEHREGSLMADFLMRTGVPHSLIEVDANSTSTLTNATGTLRIIGNGLVEGGNHLGIVSHRSHAERLRLAFNRLGIPKSQIGLHTLPESPSTTRYEAVMRGIFRVATTGAHTEPQLARRDHLLEVAHDRLTLAASRIKNLLPLS